MRKKRALSPQAPAKDPVIEKFLGIVETDVPEEFEVSPDEGIEEVFPNNPGNPKPDIPPPEFDTVTAYLKDQVLREMYGTSEPTNYERTISAIRKRL